MLRHVFVGLITSIAIAVWAAPQVLAAEKTHEGSVVSVAAGKLVMVDKEGKNEHSHVVPATAKVTLDGKSAKLTDLQKGDAIKVTTEDEGNVVAIAATRSKG